MLLELGYFSHAVGGLTPDTSDNPVVNSNKRYRFRFSLVSVCANLGSFIIPVVSNWFNSQNHLQCLPK